MAVTHSDKFSSYAIVGAKVLHDLGLAEKLACPEEGNGIQTEELRYLIS